MYCTHTCIYCRLVYYKLVVYYRLLYFTLVWCRISDWTSTYAVYMYLQGCYKICCAILKLLTAADHIGCEHCKCTCLFSSLLFTDTARPTGLLSMLDTWLKVSKRDGIGILSGQCSIKHTIFPLHPLVITCTVHAYRKVVQCITKML